MTPLLNARRTSSVTDRTHTSASSCCRCTPTSSRPCRTCCGRTTMYRLRSLLLAFLLIIVALPLAAEDDDDSRFEAKYGKNFAFSGGRVTINHGFGDLVVRTHQGSDVQVRATIRSSDEEMGKAIRIVGTTGPNGVTVTTNYPTIRKSFGRLSFSV